MEMGSQTSPSRGNAGLSRYVDVAKTLYHRARAARPIQDSTDPREHEVLAALRRQGYFVIENFQDRAKCAELVREIERVFHDYEPLLWSDQLKADTRAYAADRVSEPVRKFFEDPLITNVMHRYMGEEEVCFFTLANRVRPIPGNLGSGGGWHRDTVHQRQFKAILYLVDVGPRCGPFEYLPGSHRVSFIAKMIASCGITFGQNRFTEDEVSRIEQRSGAKRIRFTAPAGTLIIADTSGIHRGSPIEEGERYAMTNYCYDPGIIKQYKAQGKFTNYFVDRDPSAAGVKV
jgi:hypothetical protein